MDFFIFSLVEAKYHMGGHIDLVVKYPGLMRVNVVGYLHDHPLRLSTPQLTLRPQGKCSQSKCVD